ncbi:MAG: hypothetical protein HY077_07470 [Elusimicrobia bacterium]|nr:hypothetical protein [Elusimicrobiota bacterium]
MRQRILEALAWYLDLIKGKERVIGAAFIAAGAALLAGTKGYSEIRFEPLPRSFNELKLAYEKAQAPAPESIGGVWSGYCLPSYPRPEDKTAFKEMQLLSVDARSKKFIRVPLVDTVEGSDWTPSRFEPDFRLDEDRAAEVRSAIEGSRAYHRSWRADESGLRCELAYPGEPPQKDYLRQGAGALVLRHDIMRFSYNRRREETNAYCYFGSRLKEQ